MKAEVRKHSGEPHPIEAEVRKHSGAPPLPSAIPPLSRRRERGPGGEGGDRATNHHQTTYAYPKYENLTRFAIGIQTGPEPHFCSKRPPRIQ